MEINEFIHKKTPKSFNIGKIRFTLGRRCKLIRLSHSFNVGSLYFYDAFRIAKNVQRFS